MIRHLFSTSTLNTRDLGGYPTASGEHTRYLRFLRSDAPINIKDSEVEFLISNNITTVIDLRSLEEIGVYPCFFSGKQGFDYHHCPLFGSGNIPTEENEIPGFYMDMLSNSDVIYSAMKTIADADGGVLYHCTAGKDRTGVISALLLSLVEVPLSDILADYQVSHTYIRPMIEMIREHRPALPAWVGRSNPEYMESFLSEFLKKHQSVQAYLRHIGLSDVEIGRIKLKLVSD